MDRLSEQIKRHEGLSLTAYQCTGNKTTIGYGRNLDDVGITKKEAEILLRNDLFRVRLKLLSHYPGFVSLDAVRQACLVNMAFNLGTSGLMKFKKMRAALDRGDYICAATEMLNSRWARQVGSRAIELANQMRTGEWS